MTGRNPDLETWADSYNINATVGPHSNHLFNNYLDVNNYNLVSDTNKQIQVYLVDLFRRLINANDGHCRTLEKIAGGFQAGWSQWNWHLDWIKYKNFRLRTLIDDDNDDFGDPYDQPPHPRHRIMVYLAKINPCTLQQSPQLIYRIPFSVKFFTTMGNRKFENLFARVIITPKCSLRSLTMLKVIRSIKSVEEMTETKSIWNTSLEKLASMMGRLAEFAIHARTDRDWTLLVLAGGKLERPRSDHIRQIRLIRL